MTHLALHLLGFVWAHHHHYTNHLAERAGHVICFMGHNGQPGGCVSVP